MNNSVSEEEDMDHEPDRSAPEAVEEPTDDRSADHQDDEASSRLQELVAYLRDNRTELREERRRRE